MYYNTASALTMELDFCCNILSFELHLKKLISAYRLLQRCIRASLNYTIDSYKGTYNVK